VKQLTTLSERVHALFEESPVVTTDALTEALMVKDTVDRTTAIKRRAKRLGLDLVIIGRQAWILNK
jgi:hypothetical protein